MITPYVKIDYTKVKQNIEKMFHSLSKYNIAHRPHIKTHKSVEFAKLQIQYGAKGITCATLTEVEVMAKAGINDILLAMPLIGDDQWNLLASILKRYSITFTTIVDSEIGIHGLARVGETINKPLNVLVAIDGGGHREGIQPEETIPFVKQVEKNKWLQFEGLFTYFGHIYGLPTDKQKKMTKEEADLLISLKEKLEQEGINVNTLSGGSTVSSTYPDLLAGVTESRAGNCIFYDRNAVEQEVATIDDCALRIVAKVISTPMKGRATIDAGSKTMTTDQPIKGDGYGYVISNPHLKIVKLNEEHGYVEYDPEKTDVQVGDWIEIIPNHACVVPNLFNEVFLFENSKFIRPLPIDARGRNYG